MKALEMGNYPGLRGWALKVIARVPTRRRQERQSKRRGQDKTTEAEGGGMGRISLEEILFKLRLKR